MSLIVFHDGQAIIIGASAKGPPSRGQLFCANDTARKMSMPRLPQCSQSAARFKHRCKGCDALVKPFRLQVYEALLDQNAALGELLKNLSGARNGDLECRRLFNPEWSVEFTISHTRGQLMTTPH